MTMCRTCLKTPADKNMSELEMDVDIDENTKDYREIVLFCLDIKVVQDSKITTNLCDKCYTKILLFHKFKVLSLKSDEYLKSLDPTVKLAEHSISVYSYEHEIKQELIQDSNDFGPTLLESCDSEVKVEVDWKIEENHYAKSNEKLPVVQNIKYEYVEEIQPVLHQNVENKIIVELSGNDLEMNSVLGDRKHNKRRKIPGVRKNGKTFQNAKMSSSEETAESISDLLNPIEIGETEKSNEHIVLPLKSVAKYRKAYDNFISWKKDKKDESFSESLLLEYFNQLSKTLKPSTLWATYSMLKATIYTEQDLNIREYSRLTTLLKRLACGFRSKKSKALTAENVETFLRDAPDKTYLVTKVVLIFGISGACTTAELVQLKTSHVEDHNNMVLINVDTRAQKDQYFVIRGEHLRIVNKYRKLRSATATESDRFFLNYDNGEFGKRPIGRHKLATVPKTIATYLKLPDADLYNGHCFRRTSANIFADSLKRHGGFDLDREASHTENIEDTKFSINVYDHSFVSTEATVSRPSTSNEDFVTTPH